MDIFHSELLDDQMVAWGTQRTDPYKAREDMDKELVAIMR